MKEPKFIKCKDCGFESEISLQETLKDLRETSEKQIELLDDGLKKLKEFLDNKIIELNMLLK